MSSPLPVLRKTEQVPLTNEQGDNRKVQFKRNQLQEIGSPLGAADSLNPPPSPPPHPPTTSNLEAALTQDSPSRDFELMAAMMQRITVLENIVRSQAQELEQQDKIVSVLEKQLRSQGESDLEGRPCSGDDLEKRCQLLQKKLQEMENFLSDYGLIWVGDGDNSDSAESERTRSSHGRPTGKAFQMNFDLVLQRIRELNVLVGEGETFVQASGNRAKLVRKDPIQLVLYKNGIVMFDGPFRSYEEHSTQESMQDLMDGYFPSELQQRFPDGAPFEVHDHREEEFMFKPWDTIPGDRQAVYGEKSTNSVGFMPGGKLTTDQFPSKLPKMVVKAGNVVHIRSSLRGGLQVPSDAQSSSSETLIITPAHQAAMSRTQMKNSEKPTQDVITLKLKSEDGNHTYVIKMSPSETVGQLRAYLDNHRGAGQPDYEIISAYPPCSFNDNGWTLQSCGLSSNTTLLLRHGQRIKQ